ncbi:hypothetical protein J6590_067471 [Homalodisca vitripennis]|nr:hypothetical protein J6590_067471 [Homalodisca vitripennis]
MTPITALLDRNTRRKHDLQPGPYRPHVSAELPCTLPGDKRVKLVTPSPLAEYRSDPLAVIYSVVAGLR